MQESNLKPQQRLIPRHRFLLIVNVAIFGVIWGLGTSLLAGALPPDPVTRVILIGWFEVMIMLLTKVVVRHPLSVTFAIFIASTISIVTFSFGPPNPYKPLFVFAGLAFDAGTFFRTKTLRGWNLIIGSITYIATAGCIFVVIFWLLDPSTGQCRHHRISICSIRFHRSRNNRGTHLPPLYPKEPSRSYSRGLAPTVPVQLEMEKAFSQ
jgi:asparagine N-glycosylation enzyme membrane subunit Stt3